MKSAVHHPGALRKAASRAGMSTSAFAQAHKDSPGTLGKRARLAITFAKFRPK